MEQQSSKQPEQAWKILLSLDQVSESNGSLDDILDVASLAALLEDLEDEEENEDVDDGFELNESTYCRPAINELGESVVISDDEDKNEDEDEDNDESNANIDCENQFHDEKYIMINKTI